MLFKQYKNFHLFLTIIDGIIMLLVALLLTDPVALLSLQKAGDSNGMHMMCTCSVCREGPGESHYCTCSMMNHHSPKSGDTEHQICSCGMHGSASMAGYYFPYFFPPKWMTIKSPEAYRHSRRPSNSFYFDLTSLSGVFHPPKA